MILWPLTALQVQLRKLDTPSLLRMLEGATNDRLLYDADIYRQGKYGPLLYAMELEKRQRIAADILADWQWVDYDLSPWIYVRGKYYPWSLVVQFTYKKQLMREVNKVLATRTAA